MKDDAVLLVKRANEVAQLGAENAFQRARVRRDQMDFESTCSKGGCNLEANEARAQHDCAARGLGALDNVATVSQGAKRTDLPRARAGDGEPHRLGAGRQEQSVVLKCGPAGEFDCARSRIDSGDGRLETKVDAVFRIEAIRAKRKPILGRVAGEIILGEIRPIDRRRIVAAQHDDLAVILLPPEPFGRGEARRAAADDHDPFRRPLPP